MNKRNLTNEELENIGRKLLDATKVRSEQIEQIVGSPVLFDSIKARIETERRERNAKNISGEWANFQIWNWQSVSAMVLLLFTVGVISLIIFGKFTKQQIDQAAAPDIKPKIEQIETQSAPTTRFPQVSPAFVKTKSSVNESPQITKQKVFNNKTSKPRKTAVRTPNQQHRFQLKQNEPAGEFYALAFAGHPGENGEELKIIRAELSRSSLFALGVNLSIENESEKIKTDLLVGTDGVARAIRLVNKTENQ